MGTSWKKHGTYMGKYGRIMDTLWKVPVNCQPLDIKY
jgi:hypothetical protein